jgi:hypothetical protein
MWGVLPAAQAAPTATPVSGSASLNGVACVSAATCEAAGTGSSNTGVVVSVSGGTPGAAQGVAHTQVLGGVACPTATTCDVVGYNAAQQGDLVPVTGGSPGAAQPVSGTTALTGIACTSASSCEMAGIGKSTGVFVALTSGDPGTPQQAFDTYPLGVACPSSQLCVGAGTGLTFFGAVTAISAGTAGRAQIQLGASELLGAGCSSATSCDAVGLTVANEGEILPVNGGVAGSPLAVPGTTRLAGLACPSATVCEAVGMNSANEGVVVPVVNGIPQAPQTVAGSASLLGIACPSASACEAVGANASNEGVVVAITPPGATPATPVVTGISPASGPQSGGDEVELTGRGFSGASAVSFGVAKTTSITVLSDHELTATVPPAGSAGTVDVTVTTPVTTSATAAADRYTYSSSSGPGPPAPLVWSVEGTPADPVSSSYGTSLVSVSCTSDTSCVAVGGDDSGAPLAEGWNGTSWSVQSTASVPGATVTGLEGVSCPGANTCQAIGVEKGAGNYLPLAEASNGSSWSAPQAPPTLLSQDSIGAEFVTGVSCATPAECEATGSYEGEALFSSPSGPLATSVGEPTGLVEGWDGTSWGVDPVPTAEPDPLPTLPASLGSGLNGVSCTLPGACMAVGQYTPNTADIDLPLAESWDGYGWTILTVPLPADTSTTDLAGGATLAAVSCSSATSCVTVGSYETTAQVEVPFAESWNGSVWGLQSVPVPAGATVHLSGLSCIAADDCVAVGTQTDGSGTQTALAVQWDGSSWTVEPTPAVPNSSSSSLSSVSCTSATGCQAVGTYTDASGANVALAEGSTTAPPVTTTTTTTTTTPTTTPTTTTSPELAPVSLAPPTISGTPLPGDTLTCSRGTWAGGPIAFAYGWYRNGAAIAGASSATYAVQIGDEAATLTCSVRASNAAGASAPRLSAGVVVAMKGTLTCPKPSGRLSGAKLGPLSLGISLTAAHKKLTRFHKIGYGFDDFCLYAGWGIRAAAPSGRLLREIPRAKRAKLTGKIVLALTANPFYAFNATRPGALVAAVSHRLHLGKPFHIGLNTWYLAPGKAANEVFKVRKGVIQEIGIANRSLTASRSAQSRFLTSFGKG